MPNEYTNLEKMDMFGIYYECRLNADDASNVYLNRFPERRQPNKRTFGRLRENLLENGSFGKPRQQKYNKQNREDNEITVLAMAEANPKTSCRQIEMEAGISKTQVQRILKTHKYIPYKSTIIHHLRANDAERRINFSRWYLQMIQANNNFARRIVWSDETHISSAGIFNRHTNRFWADENHHITLPRQLQGRFGFNVSCFIFGGRLSYHIFYGNLNSERYLEILDTCLPELLDNIPLADLRSVYFQQDGAPSHNSRIVTDYLSRHFPRQWIGTNGPIRWPARSPDFSILDFFVWGYLKNIIYQQRHETQEQLLQATRDALEQLRRTPLLLLRAAESLQGRCHLCIQHNGQQFEQFLN